MKILACICCLASFSCTFSSPHIPGSNVPDHSLWDELLKEHVSNDGRVNYPGFSRDIEQLGEYLTLLKKNPPDTVRWTQAERLAYWINAYNAFTVQLIVQYYPLESIKDIGTGISIPFVTSPWDIKFIEIGGKKLDLNNIEHDILRKEFNEPRIHFAINCASKSCPKLRNEAYTAEKLDKQLFEQTTEFLSDPTKNRIAKNKASISKIFSWFSGDFTKKGTLIDFLNHYANEHISPNAKIDYLEYDWRLNE